VLHFRLYALRFEFSALGRLEFRAGQAANMIRGGLGAALRRVSCPPACTGPGHCPQSSPEQPNACAYARLFTPRAGRTGPSGLSDWPRPFVLRVRHLEGATVAEGSNFHIDIHLFDLSPGAVTALEAALAQIGRDGFGSQRIPARLIAVNGAVEPLELPLNSSAEPLRRITVSFLTATELKGLTRATCGNPGGLPPGLSSESTGSPRELPPFGLLAARIRDRLSTLRTLYGEGPLALNFRGFGQRADGIATVGGAVHQIAARRRSGNTGQIHSLGGLVGQVQYAGDLAEFLPYLRAAAYTGVGRQTVWGKGEIRVDGVD
jgi:hypothetical protein